MELVVTTVVSNSHRLCRSISWYHVSDCRGRLHEMDRGNSHCVSNFFSDYQDSENYLCQVWAPRVSRVRQRTMFRQRGVQVILVHQRDKAADLCTLSPIFKRIGREGRASRESGLEKKCRDH